MRRQTIGFCLIATAMSAGLMACNSDSSGNNNNTNLNPDNTPQGSHSGSHHASSGGAVCLNPIPLDGPGLQLAKPGQVWGPSNYTLDEMEVYSVDSAGGQTNSLSASAKAADGFSVKVGCADVDSSANMSASVSGAQSLNGATRTPSLESSVLSVVYNDGQLTSAGVSTQASSSSTATLGDDATSVDRQQMTGDDGQPVFLSYRVYVKGADTVELRFEIEAMNSSGNNLEEYGRIVYRAQ